MTKFDKNIPLPSNVANTKPIMYDLDLMDVGDSQFVPISRDRIQFHVQRAKTRTGWKYACRTLTEGGIEGTRIWRTK